MLNSLPVNPFFGPLPPTGFGAGPPSVSMTSVSLVWFLVNLASVLSTYLSPERTESIRLLIWSLAYLFPPLILQMSLDEAERRRPLSSRWRQGVWLGALVALLSGMPPLLHWWGFDMSRWLGPAILSLVFLFTATAAYAVAIGWVSRNRTESPRQQRARRWEFALWALVVIVLGSNLWPEASSRESLSLIAPAFPLLFVFASTYHLERFLFFDLFVKRGAFSCLVLILIAAHFAVLSKVLENLEMEVVRPWIYALGLLPLALLLPWLYRRFEEGVDRAWLGRLFRPLDAIKHFLTGIQSAGSEIELVRGAESLVSEIFQAPTQIHLSTAPPADKSGILVPFQIQPGVSGTIQLGGGIVTSHSTGPIWP